jgi:hypothetical protein
MSLKWQEVLFAYITPPKQESMGVVVKTRVHRSEERESKHADRGWWNRSARSWKWNGLLPEQRVLGMRLTVLADPRLPDDFVGVIVWSAGRRGLLENRPDDSKKETTKPIEAILGVDGLKGAYDISKDFLAVHPSLSSRRPRARGARSAARAPWHLGVRRPLASLDSSCVRLNAICDKAEHRSYGK